MRQQRDRHLCVKITILILLALMLFSCRDEVPTCDVDVQVLDGVAYQVTIEASNGFSHAVLRQWSYHSERPIEVTHHWSLGVMDNPYQVTRNFRLLGDPIWGYVYDQDGNAFYFRSDEL